MGQISIYIHTYIHTYIFGEHLSVCVCVGSSFFMSIDIIINAVFNFSDPPKKVHPKSQAKNKIQRGEEKIKKRKKFCLLFVVHFYLLATFRVARQKICKL